MDHLRTTYGFTEVPELLASVVWFTVPLRGRASLPNLVFGRSYWPSWFFTLFLSSLSLEVMIRGHHSPLNLSEDRSLATSFPLSLRSLQPGVGFALLSPVCL